MMNRQRRTFVSRSLGTVKARRSMLPVEMQKYALALQLSACTRPYILALSNTNGCACFIIQDNLQ